MDIGSSLYHYKAYFETLLSYGREAKFTHLESAGFYTDQPETADDNKTNSTVSIMSGYDKRKKLVEKSQTWSWCTSLHIDFLQCNRWLPPGVHM